MGTKRFLCLLIIVCVVFPLAARNREESPTVGLVLSGGSALGFAHIGVLKVIDDVGIPIDYVVGTSMGGLVGGLYAAGYSPEEIDVLAEQTDWIDIFTQPDSPYTYYSGPVIEQQENIISFSFDEQGLGRSLGLFPDQKILSMLSEVTAKVSHIRDFDELPVPFRTVAVNLMTREETVFESGRLVDALRSTMAVPGLFSPYEVDGNYYIDGGILNSLPVNVAREMGADIVIAVNVDWDTAGDIKEMRTTLEVIVQITEIVIMANESRQIPDADVYIKPDLSDMTPLQFTRYREFIERGEEAAKKMLPELEKLKDNLSQTRDVSTISNGYYHSLPVPKVHSVILAPEVDFFFPLEMFSDFTGRAVTPLFHRQIQRVINQIVATGKYESISYGFRRDPERSDALLLELKPVTLERGKHSFGVGFSFSGGFIFEDGGNEFYTAPALTTSLVFTELFESNSYATFNAKIGKKKEATGNLFVPMGGVVYLNPNISVLSETTTDASSTEIFNRSTVLSVGQEVGFLLGQFAEIGAAIEASILWLDQDVENNGDTSTDFELLYGPSFTWKSTEKKRFLHEGVISQAEVLLPLYGKGGWYSRLYLSHEHYLPLGYNSTLSYELKVGSYRGECISSFSRFDLGGWDAIPGYLPGDIVTDDIVTAGVTYQQRFDRISEILGMDVYAMGSLRIGDGWDDDTTQFDLHPRFGGSIGIGLGSMLGDIVLGAGINDQGNIAYYLLMN